MGELTAEVYHLIENYGDHTKQALKEHSKLEYLYALSDIRENLLEWYPFKKEGKMLQVGADFGALTGLFARRLKEVVVLDESDQQLKVCQKRYSQSQLITYRQGDLTELLMEEGNEGTFNYISFIGSLADSAKQQLKAAKRLLMPGGTLIFAVCNPLGVKYLAGAKRDKHSFTKNEMQALLEDQDGMTEWYYPMPDYRLPNTIYSQHSLPKRGDLTKPLIAYDYPKYLQLDSGAMYDMLCSNHQFEQFANSFLVFWKKQM